jgi:alkylation response protein AidB-like acyl-CoA dehydrogenase
MGYTKDTGTDILIELSRASASVALSYGAHSNLCVNQIHRHGTKEQKQKYLPPLIAGDKVRIGYLPFLCFSPRLLCMLSRPTAPW